MSWFPEYTIESAPAGSRRFMVATQNHLGYLPAATARWAASPHLLEGFGRMLAIFENVTLDPVAREVVVMTIATKNACHVCVAMHTARLTALGASPDVISALRDASPVRDGRLEAVRVFTLRVLDTAGDVGDDALAAFLACGYTRQHADHPQYRGLGHVPKCIQSQFSTIRGYCGPHCASSERLQP